MVNLTGLYTRGMGVGANAPLELGKLFQNHVVSHQQLSLHPYFWPQNQDFLNIRFVKKP